LCFEIKFASTFLKNENNPAKINNPFNRFLFPKATKFKKRAIMKDEIVGELHQLHSLKH
jgi:hypothetical protein